MVLRCCASTWLPYSNSSACPANLKQTLCLLSSLAKEYRFSYWAMSFHLDTFLKFCNCVNVGIFSFLDTWQSKMYLLSKATYWIIKIISYIYFVRSENDGPMGCVNNHRYKYIHLFNNAHVHRLVSAIRIFLMGISPCFTDRDQFQIWLHTRWLRYYWAHFTGKHFINNSCL